MLNLTTALGRNGLQDWLLQRISAAILGLYSIFLLGFWLLHTRYNPAPWQNLFHVGLMRFATVIALLALMVHAWIGLWMICTDYIHTAAVRIFIFIFIYVFLLFDLIWCLQILWGY